MKKLIPQPIIALLSTHLSNIETHAGIDNLFLYANAPDNILDGAKQNKITSWLRQINTESETPLDVLGKIIEPYIEHVEGTGSYIVNDLYGDTKLKNIKMLNEKLIMSLCEYGLIYLNGGRIVDKGFVSDKSLIDALQHRDAQSIEREFERAISKVNTEPREAVSAASNILESLFKVFIEDQLLEYPSKQDIKSLWKVIQTSLSFDPHSVEDDDLKKPYQVFLQ